MAGEPGILTLSFDVELAWGELDRGRIGAERLLEARRRFPELLALLERHRLRATFAFVGHLLLDGCAGHPELAGAPAAARGGERLAVDPRGDERSHPLWYAPTLFEQARRAGPGHDLGAHGFTHLPLDRPQVGPATAEAEMAACARVLRARGLEPASFVFPRNDLSYTEILSAQGFKCYRGRDARWYLGAPRPVRRVAHVLEQALAATPPVGRPRRAEGLVEAPSSMLFLSREGLRRRIPIACRVRRALAGLARAAESGAVFHLWMHAEDLVPDAPLMLAALDRVYAAAAALRERGRLVVRAMADLEAAA